MIGLIFFSQYFFFYRRGVKKLSVYSFVCFLGGIFIGKICDAGFLFPWSCMNIYLDKIIVTILDLYISNVKIVVSCWYGWVDASHFKVICIGLFIMQTK